MKYFGYNSVRVFINEDSLSTESTTGLSSGYLDNMVDFIKLSDERGIYVFIQISVNPHNSHYLPAVTDPNMDSSVGGYNRILLDPGAVEGKKRFVHEFVSGLKSRGAPLSAIMGYSVVNEPYFVKNAKPFSLNSGNIAVANGHTYNLVSAEDKTKMSEEGLVYYVDTLKETILSVDPQALVGITFFSPAAVDSQPNMILSTDKIFSTSKADFVAINSYPVAGNTNLEAEMNALHMGSRSKARIVSEFGAYPVRFNNSLAGGAAALKDFQFKTCSQYGFVGWFPYEWDTTEYDQWFRIYHVMEGNGEINQALAPIYRALPCKTENAPLTLGNVENITCSVISGWTGKITTPTTPIDVHIYADGEGDNHIVGSATANGNREQAVCDSLGSSETPCRHGFVFSVPQTLKDGKPHVIDIYSVNGADNPKLPGSGKTITCTALATGDANNDGKVDTEDADLVKLHFGSMYTIFDYNVVVENFGK